MHKNRRSCKHHPFSQEVLCRCERGIQVPLHNLLSKCTHLPVLQVAHCTQNLGIQDLQCIVSRGCSNRLLLQGALDRCRFCTQGRRDSLDLNCTHHLDFLLNLYCIGSLCILNQICSLYHGDIGHQVRLESAYICGLCTLIQPHTTHQTSNVLPRL